MKFNIYFAFVCLFSVVFINWDLLRYTLQLYLHSNALSSELSLHPFSYYLIALHIVLNEHHLYYIEYFLFNFITIHLFCVLIIFYQLFFVRQQRNKKYISDLVTILFVCNY